MYFFPIWEKQLSSCNTGSNPSKEKRTLSGASSTSSFLSSQVVSNQVLSTYECLTTVFGMGTGGTTQLSPLDIVSDAVAPSKLYRRHEHFRVLAKLSGQRQPITYALRAWLLGRFRIRAVSESTAPLRVCLFDSSAAVNVSQSRCAFSLRSWDVFARGAFADSQSESDAPASQALGVLVRVGCTPCGASTPRLSTSSSLRRLTGLLREKLHLRAGFTLRCFQRLSFPDAATQLHGWRHDWYTVGPSTPVLSY